QTFLREALVVDRQEMSQAPYLVAGSDGRVIYAQNDTVYAVDPVTKWAELIQSYGVFRVGHRYVDPETKEILGIEALRIGTVRTTDQRGEMATFRVVEAREGMRPEDRLFTSREGRMQSMFYP